jgi:hypothetical protein
LLPSSPSCSRWPFRQALARGREPHENVYGDGHAAQRIVKLIATLPLDAALLAKTNAY